MLFISISNNKIMKIKDSYWKRLIHKVGIYIKDKWNYSHHVQQSRILKLILSFASFKHHYIYLIFLCLLLNLENQMNRFCVHVLLLFTINIHLSIPVDSPTTNQMTFLSNHPPLWLLPLWLVKSGETHCWVIAGHFYIVLGIPIMLKFIMYGAYIMVFTDM